MIIIKCSLYLSILVCRNYFKKYDIVCDVTMKLSFEMKRLNYLALILPNYRISYPNKKISFSLTRNNSDWKRLKLKKNLQLTLTKLKTHLWYFLILYSKLLIFCRTTKSRRTFHYSLRPLDRSPNGWRQRLETRQRHQQGSVQFLEDSWCQVWRWFLEPRLRYHPSNHSWKLRFPRSIDDRYRLSHT